MGEDLLDVSVIDHGDAVGDIHDLVQLIGDEQDCDSLVALPDQHLVHIFDRAHVQTAGRLDGDQEFGVIGDLTSDDDLLLIAAGEASGLFGPAVLRTDVIFPDQLVGKCFHLFAVDLPAGRKLLGPVFFQDRIFIDGKGQDQTVLVTVRGDRRQPPVDAVFGIFVLDLLSAEKDLAPGALPEVIDRVHQLRLSVAVDAGDPDDLSGPDLEIKVLYRVDLLFIFDIESLNVEDDLTGVRRRRIDDQVNGTSDHFFRQFVLRDPLHRHGVDVLAAADDGALIGGSLDLLELVGDDDDRLAVLDQVFHDM